MITDYQREIEKNYEPQNWTAIDDIPQGTLGLEPMELFYFCNSDSARFADFCRRLRGDKAMLLDYELLSLGFEPIQGSALRKLEDGTLILTVFTAEGGSHFRNEPGAFKLPFS